MTKVFEFKNIREIQDYLDNNLIMTRFEIIPVPKMFEHPTTKLIVSCISYILIIN